MPRRNLDLDAAIEQLNKRKKDYDLYRRYYDGDHRLAFASEKFLNAFGELFRAFADNLCPNIVDTLVNRLQIEGFGFPKSSAIQEAQRAAILKQVDMIWDANKMERRAGETHLEAALAADAYVIVWPNKAGDPVIYPNKADRMTVRYSEENPGELLWAAKRWVLTDRRVRVNLYYADRIEKWVSGRNVANAYVLSLTKNDTTNDQGSVLAGGFTASRSLTYEPYLGDGDTDQDGILRHDYGRVPVFHLANNASVGDFGRSELKNAIPLQDALNKSIADMLVAMEFVALPQRYATGVEVPTDPNTGKPIAPWVPGVDRLWTTRNKDATFGQFTQADLSQFLAAQDGFRLEMSRVTSTPVHYMNLQPGNFPSGEALKTAETPFTAKVDDRTPVYGEFWADVMSFCLTILGKRGVVLETRWKETAPTSTADLMNFLTAAQGLKSRVLLKRAGFTEDEITELGVEAGDLVDAMLRAAVNGRSALPGGNNGAGPQSDISADIAQRDGTQNGE